MDFITFILQYAVPFLAILTVLVFVHELGHFLLARWNGVKVEVFSVGFGNELWGFNDKHGTRWRLSSVPLGGYVKMFGEGDMITGVDDTEDRPMTEDEKKVSFHHKNLRQRTAVVAAGPLANFLFAVLVFWAINAAFGVPTLLSAVGEVIEDTAAEEAGFQAGDVILSIDGRAITEFNELSEIVSANPHVTLNFEVLRGDAVLHLNATPRTWKDPEADDEESEHANTGTSKGLLGVRPSMEHVRTERTGIFHGLVLGVEQTYFFTANILAGLGEMFSGERSANELGGVLSIAQFSGEAAQGGIVSTLRFLAILSINLGLINLFPVPVLDGGHLVFYMAEALRGKPLSQKLQEYSFRFGLVLVLLLMIFATWNDFGRLFEKFG
ncbi:RIP metalloprotease RseP [Magnetovibrio sp.]|uniref:RIP metalloprotease RseP n=1 Tax=Magnetovibrio sp. TaxID=2024836 RepID=UPI002F9587E5